MTKATLVLLRHGETTYNAERKLTGHHDIALTAKGEAQADRAGKLINGIPFDKVYSSHLQRAFNTAARALTASGAHAHLQNEDGSWKIEQRCEIAEIDWGIFSGMSKDEPTVKAFSWHYDATPPNGESQQAACARVRKFYESEILPRLERGENVLIVAHSGILHSFNVIFGITQEPAPGTAMIKDRVENAVPTIYDFEDGKLKGFTFIQDPANENDPPAAHQKKNGGPKP